MISFIVIGKNEAFSLNKCFHSIIKISKEFNLIDFEVIYIDSASTDGSIEIALNYTDIIVSLKGDCNAAIARNLGANVSKGDFLIFLDGDMELQPTFFKILFDDKLNPNYSYVSGDIFNVFYDSNNKKVGEGYYYKYKLDKDVHLPYTGGFFCIKKEIWNLVGGMHPKYRRSQDLDFGFRLARKGILILRKKELGVIHNTISYFDKKRMWSMLKKNDFGYRAVLYRDHLFNPRIYKMLIRTDYTLIFLVLILMFACLSNNASYLIGYPSLVTFRAIFQLSNDKNNKLHKLTLIMLRDIQMLFSLLFFHPKKNRIYTTKFIS